MARMLIRDRWRLSLLTAKIAPRISSVMLGCPPPRRVQRPSAQPATMSWTLAVASRRRVRSLIRSSPSMAASSGSSAFSSAALARRRWASVVRCGS
ncbi:hypothetical protein [Streptomyces sp. NPDC010273]|uniref:hypothetical protein n=1 Tax=Streptomyces sp. NPDC010273 TaxID=3364829 RepID=UPI0036E579FC